MAYRSQGKEFLKGGIVNSIKAPENPRGIVTER